MSTPEEPPQLTRRQLRELRNTAATPIITEPAEPREEPVVAPLPRAAEPIALPEAPQLPDEPETSDDASELGAAEGTPALTRREIRQRERLRTASVPVIPADVIDGPADAIDAEVAVTAAEPEQVVEAEIVDEPVDAGTAGGETPADVVHEEHPESDASSGDDQEELRESGAAADAVSAGEAEPQDADAGPAAHGDAETHDAEAQQAEAENAQEDDAAADAERPVVAPELGAQLLKGEPAEVELPASFDQLLTRGSTATGALSMPNALILSQTPDAASLGSPVTATGEVLITGTFSLPDSYGSTGTVPGRADGKDVDAVLVDGELPAASSPTPIAASAAISTIKSADEIIKPPVPEKGSRLMIILAITAGVLAVALAGVLILAITTGVL